MHRPTSRYRRQVALLIGGALFAVAGTYAEIFENGLWPDARIADVPAVLGRPSFRQAAWRSYDYEGKGGARCAAGRMDVSAWARLRVHAGRIDALQVGQVSSC